MLEISREDVQGNYIDQTSSHIPFNIDKFLETIILRGKDGKQIPLKPITPQIALINAILNSNYRFIVAVLARRTGKTLIANALGLLTILEPDTDVLVISPNYNLSLISYELQKKFVKSFGIEVIKDNQKDRVLTLANGSSIRMGSVNMVDATVGRSYKFIIFDEAALTNKGEDAFNISLRPTLDLANSKVVFISSPRGHNWFHDFYMRGFSPDYPEWVSIRSTYHENPRVVESDIQEAKLSLSKAAFSQEYLAEFNQMLGAVYELRSDCIVHNLASTLCLKEMTVLIGADFCFRDATAYVVIAIDEDERKAYLIDEYQGNGKTTAQYAAALKKLEIKYDPDIIFGDSASAQTLYDMAQDYDISIRKSKKAKLEGIAFVGSFIDNDCLIVDGSCEKSLEALNKYQWKESINSKDEYTRQDTIHNEASHLNDAIRYCLYSYSQNMIG